MQGSITMLPCINEHCCVYCNSVPLHQKALRMTFGTFPSINLMVFSSIQTLRGNYGRTCHCPPSLWRGVAHVACGSESRFFSPQPWHELLMESGTNLEMGWDPSRWNWFLIHPFQASRPPLILIDALPEFENGHTVFLQFTFLVFGQCMESVCFIIHLFRQEAHWFFFTFYIYTVFPFVNRNAH